MNGCLSVYLWFFFLFSKVYRKILMLKMWSKKKGSWRSQDLKSRCHFSGGHEAGPEHQVEFGRSLQIGTSTHNVFSRKDNWCYFQPADLHINIEAIIMKQLIWVQKCLVSENCLKNAIFVFNQLPGFLVKPSQH